MAGEGQLEELNERLKNLTRKKYQSLIDIDALDKEIINTSEKIYEISPEFVKVVCFQCNGRTYIDSDETDEKGKRKKVKCPVCQMKGFLWMKLHKEVVK